MKDRSSQTFNHSSQDQEENIFPASEVQIKPWNSASSGYLESGKQISTGYMICHSVAELKFLSVSTRDYVRAK
jgi:hypothetical protein